MTIKKIIPKEVRAQNFREHTAKLKQYRFKQQEIRRGQEERLSFQRSTRR